jgi:pentose-5-phosphate-3-epimerase
MGIDRQGSQGEPADPHHKDIALIKQLRTVYPDLPLQVDGAVTLERVETLVEAGANRFVVGSAIVHAQSPGDAYKALYTRANGAQ